MAIDLPVREVTCLEDRAVVTRAGSVQLVQGRQRLKVEGVSPVVADRSLTVSVAGAQVVSARVERSWRKPPEVAETELQERLERAQLERSLKEGELSRLQTRAELERNAKQDVLRAMGEQAAANQGASDAWRAQLARAREAIAKTDEAILAASRERDRLARQVNELSRARSTEVRKPILETAIELEVDAPAAGPAAVKIRYLVACAAWRPAYRARLFEQEGQTRVSLEGDAVVWQATGEAWQDVTLDLSTERPTLGTEPPVLTEDLLHSREKSAQEKRVVDVAIREQAIQTLSEGSGEMMGVDDGGEVRVLRAREPVTVPSDGRAHRLPLFGFETAAEAEVLAAPEKSPLASLVAKFENTGPSVLLAGPVELARQNGYVGRGQLRFAAKGEQVRLGFGSEDRLRVTRQVSEEATERMLTGRKTTRYRVKLFLSNLSDTPAPLAIEERIPVSEIQDVQVEWVKKEATAPKSIDENGIVRYAIDLEPLGKRELTLVYEVSAAAKVQGL